MKLASLGEFGLIGRIAKVVDSRADVVTGIGDDAAVTLPSPGMLQLTTTDMLVEGVHFDRSFTSPHLLGHKSLAVNLSDIAAMGGVPRHCYLSLALPSSLAVEVVDEFMEGLLALAREHDVALAGGDTCASLEGLVISLTVVGEQRPDLVVRRSGARPGDLILVTGCLGDSALGLRMLRQGMRTGEPVMRHLAPTPRLREGQFLAGKASAMIDISDGLAADLGHICRQSGVGARLERDRLPLSPDMRRMLDGGDASVWDLATAGGEDYELLFTLPPHQGEEVAEALACQGTMTSIIGTITGEEGLLLVGPGGEELSLAERGFDHFCSQG